jgi:hypothetical protein
LARELRYSFEAAYEAWGAVTNRPFIAPEFSTRSGAGASSRARLIREIFADYLPRYDRFHAFCNVDIHPDADDEGWGFYPLGGQDGQFPDEIQAWREAVVQNPVWLNLPAPENP